MLTILVIFSVVVVVNSTIMCLEVVVYDCKSLEVSYSKDTSIWCINGSITNKILTGCDTGAE